MKRNILLTGAASLLVLRLSVPADAQSLENQVARTANGVVRMSFPSRPGVCGYGSSIGIRRPDRDDRDGMNFLRWNSDSGWNDREDCEPGPVSVDLELRGGQVEDVDAYVGRGPGNRQAAANDLGMVAAADAAAYLVRLAERSPERAGKEAVLAAALANGVTIHPELLRIAANAQVPRGTRKNAVFWAGESGAPIEELNRLYARIDDRQVKEHVIFVISQRRDPAAARELLRIARSDEDTNLQKKAVFWLGQAAGQAVARDLNNIVDDDRMDTSVREQAVFALSQRPRDEGVPALIRIAREHSNPKLRKRALFWLGQSGDPRALALFEEILIRP